MMGLSAGRIPGSLFPHGCTRYLHSGQSSRVPQCSMWGRGVPSCGKAALDSRRRKASIIPACNMRGKSICRASECWYTAIQINPF